MADEPIVPVQAEAPTIAQVAPQPATVNVVDPDTGEVGSIPHSQLADATNMGYTMATPEQVHNHFRSQEYGGIGQTAGALAEGAGQGFAGPLSPLAEKVAGVKEHDILEREAEHPIAHGVGEALGLGAGFMTGAGEAAAATHIAEAALPGLTEGAGALARIGSGAAKAAIENMVIAGGDEASKYALNDPNSVETSAVNIGLSGILGGVIGGGTHGAEELWHATLGGKTSGLLKAITDRVGGQEGVIGSEVDNLIDKTGMKLAPEIRAGLSSDPAIQEMVSTLNQSDTTPSGRAFQASHDDFRKQAADAISEAFGKKADAIPAKGEVSKFEHGQAVGKALAEEYDTQIKPVSDEYDSFYKTYKNVELNPSIAEKLPELQATQAKIQKNIAKLSKEGQKAIQAGSPEKAIEVEAQLKDLRNQLKDVQASSKAGGTTDNLAQKVGTLAQERGWSISPSSEIMSHVNRIMKELPNLKTLTHLSDYIKSVGDIGASNPLNGPLRNAMGAIKGVLREEEANIIGRHVASEEGADAIERYAATRKKFAEVAKLKDAVDDRLHAKGSVSGYGKSIREMAKTDAETLLNRLSGKGDADWLSLVSKRFPKTAEAIKNYHINDLLSKAKDGEHIKPEKFLKSLQEGLSPELRSFIASPEALGKAQAVGSLLEQFNKLPHNFSNTGRTIDKLMQYVPGSVVGMASMLIGHNPAVGLILGSLTKTLGKDVPDATRLALLKFLGSNAEIQPGAFKAAVEMIHNTLKGESIVSKATKALFVGGREALPQALQPKSKDTEKLDKQIKALQTAPERLNGLGGSTAHYLPDHGAGLGTMATNVVSYINAQRPNESPKAPLDPKPQVSADRRAAFNRILTIAEQPLMVIKHIQDGTLSSKDVVAMHAMYPNLYSRLVAKMGEEITSHVEKGNSVPYQTRIGLSLFMGQPMDSTMAPASILAAQPKPPQGQPGNATTPPAGPKHSMNALNKMPAMYQTADQKREERKES